MEDGQDEKAPVWIFRRFRVVFVRSTCGSGRGSSWPRRHDPCSEYNSLGGGNKALMHAPHCSILDLCLTPAPSAEPGSLVQRPFCTYPGDCILVCQQNIMSVRWSDGKGKI